MEITKALVVDLMKRQIVADILGGQVPKGVGSFTELHDYVDANYYGDFYMDEMFDALTEFFGNDGRDQFISECQDLVDEWLKAGRP